MEAMKLMGWGTWMGNMKMDVVGSFTMPWGTSIYSSSDWEVLVKEINARLAP